MTRPHAPYPRLSPYLSVLNAKNLLLLLILPFFNPYPAWGAPKKTLVVGSTAEFESLHPLIASSAPANYINRTTNPSIVYVDENWKWTCYLCEELPTLKNGLSSIVEDGGKKRIKSKWTIKSDFAWSDGKPLTAKDFYLGYQIGSSQNVLVPERTTFERIHRIELDPKDPRVFYTISTDMDYRFNTIQELSPIPEHIEGPIWEKTKSQSGAYEKASLYTTHPTSPGLHFGAYMVQEVSLGSHLSLAPNPHWKRAHPKTPKIIFKVIPNNQALDAALMTNQVDLISEIGTSIDQCINFEERLKKDADLSKKLKIVYKNGILLGQLTLNHDVPALSDKRVRQAIQMGIDREKLLTALFKGKVTIAHQFFSAADSLYDPTLPPITYQPQEAEKLLEDAQWKKGPKGIRSKDGKSLQIQLIASSGIKSLEVAQQFIQAELRKIGIEVTLKTEPARVFFGETIQKRSYQGIALFSWISNPYDIPSTLFLSKSIPTKENSWSGQNIGGWKNPEVDRLLTEAAQELDESKRLAKVSEFNKLYRDEVPQIPLYHRPDCAVIPQSLGGFKLYGSITKSNFSMQDWELSLP